MFFCHPPPTGNTAGYRAPLSRFVETSISGGSATPVRLTGEYAQTYRPGHHNFSETFVFEPARDPGVSPEQFEELSAAGGRVVRVDTEKNLLLVRGSVPGSRGSTVLVYRALSDSAGTGGS